MDIPDAVRHSSSRVVFESYADLGYNYRMTDLQAAVAREQLRRLPEVLERRRKLAARYKTLLNGKPFITAPMEPEWAHPNWQSYCVRLCDDLRQRDVMQILLDHGIATRRGVMCAHREPAYEGNSWRCGSRDCSRESGCNHLRESEGAQDHSIIVPLFHDLTEQQQERVVAELIAATEACAAGSVG